MARLRGAVGGNLVGTLVRAGDQLQECRVAKRRSRLHTFVKSPDAGSGPPRAAFVDSMAAKKTQRECSTPLSGMGSCAAMQDFGVEEDHITGFHSERDYIERLSTRLNVRELWQFRCRKEWGCVIAKLKA